MATTWPRLAVIIHTWIVARRRHGGACTGVEFPARIGRPRLADRDTQRRNAQDGADLIGDRLRHHFDPRPIGTQEIPGSARTAARRRDVAATESPRWLHSIINALLCSCEPVSKAGQSATPQPPPLSIYGGMAEVNSQQRPGRSESSVSQIRLRISSEPWPARCDPTNDSRLLGHGHGLGLRRSRRDYDAQRRAGVPIRARAIGSAEA